MGFWLAWIVKNQTLFHQMSPIILVKLGRDLTRPGPPKGNE